MPLPVALETLSAAAHESRPVRRLFDFRRFPEVTARRAAAFTSSLGRLRSAAAWGGIACGEPCHESCLVKVGMHTRLRGKQAGLPVWGGLDRPRRAGLYSVSTVALRSAVRSGVRCGSRDDERDRQSAQRRAARRRRNGRRRVHDPEAGVGAEWPAGDGGRSSTFCRFSGVARVPCPGRRRSSSRSRVCGGEPTRPGGSRRSGAACTPVLQVRLRLTRIRRHPQVAHLCGEPALPEAQMGETKTKFPAA